MVEKDYDKLKQIEEAIQAFDNKKLYESSLALYKSLDYQSNKTDRISPNNYEGLIESFNLPKNSINKEKAFVSHWKHIEFIFQVADSEITRVQSLFDTGEVDRNEYQSFLFFTIHLKEETYKRGDLVKITRELNIPFKMPVIVLFHYGNKLTLSIIDRRLHKKDSSKDVLEKVTLIKDIDIANPQRAHKEILKDLSLNDLYKKFQFHSFLKLHEAWKATLNTSELNKKFYKELAYWYFWALQEVKFPDDELKDDKTRNPVNVIRLITRLIFVWFLKEKKLVPDELFNKKELDKILDYKDKTGSTYYKAILQNLFFATLNTEMNRDVKDKNKISRTFVKRNAGVPHYFRYDRLIKDKERDRFSKLMDNIPFLNGGLFECLDKRFKDNSKDIFIDGFSQHKDNETIVKVPDYLFFSEPKSIDLNNTFHTKGKKYEVRGLIDILSRYKFTIEENTPVEEEVALDPELLGKVFENLLASYNEETETTARKLTGSFYTPREIVNYMVDESLISYLCNSLLKEDNEKNWEDLNDRLHHLFSYTVEEAKFTNLESKDLVDAIDNCKILDPACGSGAFPMGILHKLVFILSKIDPNNKKWKQKQQDKAKRDKVLAERMEDDKNRDAAIKEIDKRIEDIEKAFDQNNHELDFARKLYLIENCIYGVDKQPVAIQISKLRFFIALIVDQKTENESEPNRGIRPLPNLETKFVAADTLISIEKPIQLTLVNQDQELQNEIKTKEDDIHRVREKHFRARTPDTKEKYRLLDAQHREKLASLLERDGFPKDATKKLASWNPYDQNKFAEFFDPMWMFEIDKGFDIVIGNPPYVFTRDVDFGFDFKSYIEKIYFSKLDNSSKKSKSVQTGKINLFAIFILKGLNLLSTKGTLSFILPNNLLRTTTFERIRKHIITKSQINQIVDLGSGIFDNVTASTIILILNNLKTSKKAKIITDIEDISANSFKENYLNQDLFLKNTSHSFNIFLDSESIDISNSIKKGKRRLGDLCIDIMEGIVAHKHLIKPSKEKGYVELLEGKDIKRFFIADASNFLLWDKNQIHRTRPDYVWENHIKIIIQRISGGTRPIVCAIDLGKRRTFASVNNLILKDNFDENYYFICGVLNSKLINWYYGNNFSNNSNLTVNISKTYLDELPICEFDRNIALLTSLIHTLDLNSEIYFEFESIINASVYELYFEEEMKKAGVSIRSLIEKDLEAVKKLSPEKATAKLYEQWMEPKNEVRNRLLLISTRCPDTIGVIEASL